MGGSKEQSQLGEEITGAVELLKKFSDEHIDPWQVSTIHGPIITLAVETNEATASEALHSFLCHHELVFQWETGRALEMLMDVLPMCDPTHSVMDTVVFELNCWPDLDQAVDAFEKTPNTEREEAVLWLVGAMRQVYLKVYEIDHCPHIVRRL